MAISLLAVAAPVARSQTTPTPGPCVETPRPDPALPALSAQAQAFGFHDEELVLCAPGAGHPTNLSARLWVPAACPAAGGCPGVLVVHGFGATKETTFADMRDLATRGLYVLAYDVRGQGQSGGQADMMGPDTIADEAYVLRWFHDVVRPTKTGVYGISQGGSHALMAAEYSCGRDRAATFDSTIACDQGGRLVDAIVPVQAPTKLETVVDDGTCSQFLLTAAAESRFQPDVTASATRCALDGTPPDVAVEAVDNTISDGGLDRDNDVRDLQARVDRIDVPVYLATSYFDRLVPATNTTNIYERLRARAADPNDPYFGTDVRMIISNDAHGDIGSNFAVLSDLFTWLEKQLKGDATPLRDAPVASVQEWDGNSFRLERDWPIPGTTTATRYLSATDGGAQLTTDMPGTSTGTVANVPVVSTGPWVPVVGSAVSLQTIGLLPGDSMRYRSEPLSALTEITGLPVAHLWLSTPDGGAYGQVTIALEEVAPDGTTTQLGRMRRGFSDLSAVPTAKVIPLSTASWRIDPGNRVQLTITATDVFEATPALTNRGIVVSHGPDAPSRVELPVVDPTRVAPDGVPPAGSSFTADPVGGFCAALAIPCSP
ncbi:MAG: type transport system ATP-binding protein [Acidimicrobiaceae bacterium]|jgi:ABC-2 type transport system ATP-binding protein